MKKGKVKAKAVKKTKVAKKAAKSGLKVVNLKLNSKDRAALMARAQKFANGNLSAWLRHTGLKYVPTKKETVVKSGLRYQAQ